MSNTQTKPVLLPDGFYAPLRLLVCNYLVQLRQDINPLSPQSGTFFITPHQNYCSQWGTPPYGISQEESDQWGGGGFFIGDESQCLQKLNTDFENLSSKGFNAVRICGVAPKFNNGVLSLPVEPSGAGSITIYLSLLDDLLSLLESKGLKAILLVGAGDQWRFSALYREYLRNLSIHLKDNPTVLGYDLYNEPSLSYPKGDAINKYRTAHWVADSVWTIKQHAPRHLVTIGPLHPETVFTWDPALMPVDFVSYHFYAWNKNFPDCTDRLASLLYWAKSTSTKPWIIGETGYSGTDKPRSGPTVGTAEDKTGTAEDQKTFAEFTLQRSLDCGCLGYSWWQYQDVLWGIDYEDYLGLVSWTEPNDLANSELPKPALASFEAYHAMNADDSNCSKPPNYTNPSQHPIELTGKVVDHQGNALGNAVVWGYKRVVEPALLIANIVTGLRTTISVQGQHVLKAGDYIQLSGIGGPLGFVNGEHPVGKVVNSTDVEINVNTIGFSFSSGGTLSRVVYLSYSTYSEEDGTFGLGASFSGSPLLNLSVSYPGYSLIDTSPSNGQTYQLEPVKHNGWSKRWANNGDSTIDTWNIGAQDKFYVGDFDGDGADELLCVQTGGTTDLMKLFRFEDGDWQQVWSNGGNPAAGDGIYPYRHNILVGDFDGDGRDEILGNDTPNGWMTLFEFYNGDWHWRWSDNGNPAEGLRAYGESLTVGDFDGDGKDDLLGSVLGGGWTTWFTFDPVNSTWKWVDSDYGKDQDGSIPMSALRPYRGTFVAGDFYGNGRDGVLGNAGWITMFRVGTSGKFEWVQSNYGKALGAMHLMRSYQPLFVVGDFDGDQKQEILGFSEWATMFKIIRGNFHVVWSTYDDTRLADLKISPGTKYFSFKASPYVPHYLMAMSNVGADNYQVVLLAYDAVG